jgi:hypothetical protein
METDAVGAIDTQQSLAAYAATEEGTAAQYDQHPSPKEVKAIRK